jgi:hypothetical protein
MRRPSWAGATAGATVAALAVLAAGCGSSAPQGARTSGQSSNGAVHATDVAGGSAPWRESAPITKARALAFARAVNLTAADVPEAKASHRRKSPEHDEHTPCGLASPQDELVSIPSAKLTRGTELEVEEISSAVDVVTSDRFAIGDIAVLRSPKGRQCLERVLIKRYLDHAVGKRADDARIGRIQLSRLPVQAPGTTGSAGVRITVTVTYSYSETTVPVYIDLLVFTLGPAEVTATAASPIQPEPETTDRQLMQLLLERAKATPL